MYLGIDVGSIAIKAALLDPDRRVVHTSYTWCRGQPFERLAEVLAGLLARTAVGEIAFAAFTGTGGALAAEALGGAFVNEVVAQSASVIALYPQARSIIEMGGEDSKLIMLSGDGQARLSDFSMNGMCAAGTGSFLDQQAARMGISIDRRVRRARAALRPIPRGSRGAAACSPRAT